MTNLKPKSFSNNAVDNKNNTNEINTIKNTNKKLNTVNNSQESENQKLQEVIKFLERKIADLQKDFQDLETKSFVETPLVLQIKEKASFIFHSNRFILKKSLF